MIAGRRVRQTGWTASEERRTRLEALVWFKESLVRKGILDMFEEGASAGRQYRDMMGPSRRDNREDIMEKCRRGWCWRHRDIERIQINLSLQSLRRGLARAKESVYGSRQKPAPDSDVSDSWRLRER